MKVAFIYVNVACINADESLFIRNLGGNAIIRPRMRYHFFIERRKYGYKI